MAVSSLSPTPSGQFPLLRKTHFYRFCQFLDDLPSLDLFYATRCVSRGRADLLEAECALEEVQAIGLVLPARHLERAITEIKARVAALEVSA